MTSKIFIARKTMIRKLFKPWIAVLVMVLAITPVSYSANPAIQNGLKIDICKTPVQNDDYICESDGTATCPFTEVTVSLLGPTGSEHDIELKKAGDGDIKIDPATFKLKCGESKVVKVWGLAKSSAVDKTLIEGFIDGVKITTENMTVFKGVKIEFEGKGFINVDVREFARRPWDGRADPNIHLPFQPDLTGITIPHSTAAAVDQDLPTGYLSALSFKAGDNPDVPMFRPWTGNVSVKVTKVFGKDPSIDLVKDPLKGKSLSFLKGRLVGPAAAEFIRTPKIKFDDYFTVENTDQAKDTTIASIGAAAGIGAAALEAEVRGQAGNAATADLIKFFIDAKMWTQWAGFSTFKFKWENDELEPKAGPKLKESIAAWCLKADFDKKNKKFKTYWEFEKWNGFKMVSDIKKGKIESL